MNYRCVAGTIRVIIGPVNPIVIQIYFRSLVIIWMMLVAEVNEMEVNGSQAAETIIVSAAIS